MKTWGRKRGIEERMVKEETGAQYIYSRREKSLSKVTVNLV